MNGVPPIVPGTVARIHKQETVVNPFLQVIYCKPMDKDKDGQPRWKIALSDTIHFIQGIALSSTVPYFESKQVDAGHVIKITKYSTACLKNHNLVLLGDIDVAETIKFTGKIGEPVNIELGNQAQPTSSLPPPPAPSNYAAPQVQRPATNYNGAPASMSAPMNQGYDQQRPGGLASAERPTFPPPPPPVPQQSHSSMQPTYQQPQAPVKSFAPPPPVNYAAPSGSYGNGANQSYGNYGAFGQGIVGGGNQQQRQAMTGEDAETIYTPICGLSPYQNTFLIKARCTHKSEVRNWAKEKSKGKLFNVTLIDSTGEIRMTGFNDMVDKYFDLLQVGQVYEVSGASVKMANKRYSNVKNDYEMTMENDTMIRPVVDGATSIPAERFSFVPINGLFDKAKDEVIDVIGIAHEVGELGSITVKSTGKQLTKRDVTLLDKTGHAVRMTLWGKEAEDFADFKNRAVIAVKGVRVNDYNGRTLSTLNNSVISVNPDISEAHELRGWYDAVGYSQPPTLISVAGAAAAGNAGAGKDERKLIQQLKDENLGQFEKPDFANIVATLTYFRQDSTLYYQACPSESCSKKVIDDGPGVFRCERCQKVYDRCEYRYVMSAQVSDESGQTWLNFFNDSATAILNMSAEELHRLKIDDEEAAKKVFERALLQTYLFKLRIKQEMYQGEPKTRYMVIAALPVNHVDESKRLITKIDTVL